MKIKEIFKSIINSYKRLLFNNIKKKIKNTQNLRNWIKNGKIIPAPHIYKQKVIESFAKKYLLDIFIETGTYLGEMVNANKKKFKEIYSIELDETLYREAKKRFSRNKHISIIQGESKVELLKILSKIDEPCLFWLDAHYSGEGTAKGKSETPILDELNSILNNSKLDHVILIDDARLFTGKGDYPTLEKLKSLISKSHKDWILFIKDDIIRIYPKHFRTSYFS